MSLAHESPFGIEMVNLLGAFILLVAFAMLASRRTLSLIRLFAFQGFFLSMSIFLVAFLSGESNLYYSALFTLALKVILLPWILRDLSRRLNIGGDIETLVNVPVTMIIGIGVVVFSFSLAEPILQAASTVTRSLIGVGLACVLLSFLVMITRKKAMTQIIGFLSMENGLLFSATNATYGMPMVVELAIALDVLIGAIIFGIFFFQIRETFESLDLKYFEKLREEEG
ncbi:formate hydrogenlyase [Leptospirillum ferrooxidans]|jgi:hydrogenase-4 component E|uniref:Putative hydrogenase, membrane subunit n=1 Tax=Leptospirillum ferrooxidans (strain C2-3) TaxID=1162668 RepID=I0IS82_LEPFC|nr:formate hydrogenlyase [Leptospirillum ferrooxidans]MDA8149641.1 formate hydrogenlyase [Nitrospiraceae bacterium]BAM08131.1 putative hydrogenase, membrane subunit [Leptospirillum ferrooxidans C2-3]